MILNDFRNQEVHRKSITIPFSGTRFRFSVIARQALSRWRLPQMSADREVVSLLRRQNSMQVPSSNNLVVSYTPEIFSPSLCDLS